MTIVEKIKAQKENEQKSDEMMYDYKPYQYYGIIQLDLSEPGYKPDLDSDKLRKGLAHLREELDALQEAIYAEAKEGILILFEGSNASGKDQMIRSLISAMDPSGIFVHNIKSETAEEKSHDFLWRMHRLTPRRGEIALFNHSYYQELFDPDFTLDASFLPERIMTKDKESLRRARYDAIKDYEKYLYQSGYRIIKIYLNVSQETQKQRFLKRLNSRHQWTLTQKTMKELDEYEKRRTLNEEVINQTATKYAPWSVLPADDPLYLEYLITKVCVDTLNACHPHLPDNKQADTFKKKLLEH
jgi:polyphosphate kinase 2 (PPK2 family)